MQICCFCLPWVEVLLLPAMLFHCFLAGMGSLMYSVMETLTSCAPIFSTDYLPCKALSINTWIHPGPGLVGVSCSLLLKILIKHHPTWPSVALASLCNDCLVGHQFWHSHWVRGRCCHIDGKHWIHVARSGMIFLTCISSATWTMVIWPSRDCGIVRPSLAFSQRWLRKYGWIRVVKNLCSSRAHGVMIEKALYKQRPERRLELLLDIGSCSLHYI